MAKEAVIRKHAREALEGSGWVVWCPPKVRYHETDIFGIFDGIAWKDSDMRFIQWTSTSTMSARRKKIQKFFDENDVFCPCEVWGWDDKKKEFKKDYI